jgi:uncharacterized BrkB/YihY/UPF0761 family membrane protein
MKIMAAREREACFSVGFRKKDYLGLISFGVFVIIVGIVFVANPNLVSDFSSWIEQMTDEQHLIRPPEGFINSAILFFGLIGLFDFFKAGVRLWIVEPRRQALGDILSGVALILFAYLIHLYGGYVLTWQMVLATEAIVVGLLVVLYSIVRYVFSK